MPASGSRKLTQATWELAMLRVGPSLLGLVPAPGALPPLDAPLAEEVNGSALAADAGKQVLLLVFQGQEVAVTQTLVVLGGRPSTFTDGRRRIPEVHLAALGPTLETSGRPAPSHQITTLVAFTGRCRLRHGRPDATNCGPRTSPKRPGTATTATLASLPFQNTGRPTTA